MTPFTLAHWSPKHSILLRIIVAFAKYIFPFICLSSPYRWSYSQQAAQYPSLYRWFLRCVMSDRIAAIAWKYSQRWYLCCCLNSHLIVMILVFESQAMIQNVLELASHKHLHSVLSCSSWVKQIAPNIWS